MTTMKIEPKKPTIWDYIAADGRAYSREAIWEATRRGLVLSLYVRPVTSEDVACARDRDRGDAARLADLCGEPSGRGTVDWIAGGESTEMSVRARRCSVGRHAGQRTVWATYLVVSVTSDMWRAVRRGARVDTLAGMPTLHRLPAGGDGESAAWWTSAGRGYTRHCHTGYVARRGGHVAHADTRDEAVRLAEIRARRDATQITDAERLQRRVLRLRRSWQVAVTAADWATQHAGGRTSSTVHDVILSALATGDRVTLAVAACEAAAARARREASMAPEVREMVAQVARGAA